MEFLYQFPHITNQQSVTKTECTATIFFGVWLVYGLLASALSSILSHPSQNLPNHSNTFIHDKHASWNAFFDILKVSLAVKSLLKQNLIEKLVAGGAFRWQPPKTKHVLNTINPPYKMLHWWHFVGYTISSTLLYEYDAARHWVKFPPSVLL